MVTTEGLTSASSPAGVEVFSVAHELQPVVITSLDTRGTRAQGTHDVTTPSTPTTTPRRIGALPQSHPGLCGTPVGLGRDSHGTPVPEQGRPWVARNNLHEDDHRQTTTRHRPVSRQTSVQETSADTHLETFTKGGKSWRSWKIG